MDRVETPEHLAVTSTIHRHFQLQLFRKHLLPIGLTRLQQRRQKKANFRSSTACFATRTAALSTSKSSTANTAAPSTVGNQIEKSATPTGPHADWARRVIGRDPEITPKKSLCSRNQSPRAATVHASSAQLLHHPVPATQAIPAAGLRDLLQIHLRIPTQQFHDVSKRLPSSRVELERHQLGNWCHPQSAIRPCPDLLAGKGVRIKAATRSSKLTICSILNGPVTSIMPLSGSEPSGS